jgi:hypothetical protein
VLAYDYPLLASILMVLFFFLWIAWLWLLFKVIMDIFRSDDMGGWGKALWTIFVVFMPYLGVFVYVIARGHGMGQRDMAEAQAREAQFKAYVQQTAGSGGGGVADELSRLSDLKDSGVLTDAEFQAQKAKLLT